MSHSGRRPTADELALWRHAMGELVAAPLPRSPSAPDPSPHRSSVAQATPVEVPPPPPPDELDATAWRRALAHVVPLHGTVALPVVLDDQRPLAEPAATGLVSPPAAARKQAAFRSARLDPRRPVDLDRRSWLMLRRGRYPIDTKLDLHGLTQAEAHALLGRFLLLAAARGTRCVLVITGRGMRRGGALRAMTPRWLDEPPLRLRIIAYAPARQEHGGDGALYVLLRRPP